MEHDLTRIDDSSKGEEPLEVIAGAPDRPLVIGDVEIPCYVLEDETRVLSQRGITAGIGLNPDAGFRMPHLMSSRGISSYVSNDLRPALSTPILFKNPAGGGNAHGYPATLLPDICGAILEARRAGTLAPNHHEIADRCELLVRGIARVGIIALVDEATGFEQIRAERALATILEEFIAKELQPWTRTFPYEFYDEIFRLHGWPGPDGAKRPGVIGHYTNNIVYERLAPGVLEELRRRNPVQPSGNRRRRHHQWFTPDIGHPKLKEHLAAVTALMRASDDWSGFQQSLQRAFPALNSQLPMTVDWTGSESNQTAPRRGRPVEFPMPEPIPDTLENVAQAVLRTRTRAERDEISRKGSAQT